MCIRDRRLDAAKTRTSGPNSARSWRQIPHGLDGSRVGVTTTQARIAVSPAATAPTTALRSAQIVAPYEADSTLHPGNDAPLPLRTAAPTLNLEYGALARPCAINAICCCPSNSGRRAVACALSISWTPLPVMSEPHQATAIRRSDSVCSNHEPPAWWPATAAEEPTTDGHQRTGPAACRRSHQRDRGTVPPASLARTDPTHRVDARRSGPRPADAGQLG